MQTIVQDAVSCRGPPGNARHAWQEFELLRPQMEVCSFCSRIRSPGLWSSPQALANVNSANLKSSRVKLGSNLHVGFQILSTGFQTFNEVFALQTCFRLSGAQVALLDAVVGPGSVLRGALFFCSGSFPFVCYALLPGDVVLAKRLFVCCDPHVTSRLRGFASPLCLCQWCDHF